MGQARSSLSRFWTPGSEELSPDERYSHRCDYVFGWPNAAGSHSDAFHVRVWALGDGGNSAKKDAWDTDYWIGETVPSDPDPPSGVSVFAYDDGYVGLWICWWDVTRREVGYTIWQWRELPGDDILENMLTNRAEAGDPDGSKWACHWTDVPWNGTYYFHVWSFIPGAQSGRVVSAGEYAVPSATN